MRITEEKVNKIINLYKENNNGKQISKMLNISETSISKIIKPIKRKDKAIEYNDEIIRLYTKENLSAYKTAKILNISYQTVYDVLKKNKIERDKFLHFIKDGKRYCMYCKEIKLIEDFYMGKRIASTCIKCTRKKYHEKHPKLFGIRSNIEVYIENKVRTEFPNLLLICNDRKTIYYELDFYFPELRFAIELNGIVHYEPIYGNESFEKTQYKDKQKIILCYEKGIELCVIDISKAKTGKEKEKEEIWIKIKEILNSIVKRRNT